ncbi:MAG: hypothetical protein MK102_08865 [Fuerstiella sp.]|nr:hypothetical protein [Fuerstiella sp.]
MTHYRRLTGLRGFTGGQTEVSVRDTVSLETYSRSLCRPAWMREEANGWMYLSPIGLRAGLAVA